MIYDFAHKIGELKQNIVYIMPDFIILKPEIKNKLVIILIN